MQKIVIIGATSAIATHCARLWAARGEALFLVARNAQRLKRLLADLRVRAPGGTVEGIVADLEDFAKHEALLDRAAAALGGIDVVLIAHGSLPDQKACEVSVALAMREIRVNALSVVSLATLVANRFEAQGRGVLAVIGSVAGDRGRQSNYVYGAAKGMVAIFLQGLRNRLARRGVTVLTVKPGFVDTPMTARLEKKGPLWAKPEEVAAGIVAAIDARRDVVYLPWFWRWIMRVIRIVPESLFKRLSL